MADDPLSTPGHESTAGYRRMGDRLTEYFRNQPASQREQKRIEARREEGRRKQARLRRIRKKVRRFKGQR